MSEFRRLHPWHAPRIAIIAAHKIWQDACLARRLGKPWTKWQFIGKMLFTVMASAVPTLMGRKTFGSKDGHASLWTAPVYSRVKNRSKGITAYLLEVVSIDGLWFTQPKVLVPGGAGLGVLAPLLKVPAKGKLLHRMRVYNRLDLSRERRKMERDGRRFPQRLEYISGFVSDKPGSGMRLAAALCKKADKRDATLIAFASGPEHQRLYRTLGFEDALSDSVVIRYPRQSVEPSNPNSSGLSL